jgi:pantothenate kinase-related protein Tda10
MKTTLFTFQKTALEELHNKIADAHTMWRETNPQVISFSAPTGSGKTIIMTALFEDILYGSAEHRRSAGRYICLALRYAGTERADKTENRKQVGQNQSARHHNDRLEL